MASLDGEEAKPSNVGLGFRSEAVHRHMHTNVQQRFKAWTIFKDWLAQQSIQGFDKMLLCGDTLSAG